MAGILDDASFKLARPPAEKLLEALVAAYPERAALKHLLARAGVPVTDINWDGSQRDVWLRVLKATASAGTLRGLVEEGVLGDPATANHHLAIRALLETPSPLPLDRGDRGSRARVWVVYAESQRSWALALQRALEQALGEGDAAESVGLDAEGEAIGPRRSWVERVHVGFERARRVVLVGTPEAFAAAPARDEWEACVASFPAWHERLVTVELVATPLPPALAATPRVSFVAHDVARFRAGLCQLLALLGCDQPPDLPAGAIPAAPEEPIPAELREALVAWLAPLLRRKSTRKGLATDLGLNQQTLASQLTPELAASAARVLAIGDDDPRLALLRLLGVAEACLEDELEEEPERRGGLEALRARAEDLRRAKPDGGLLRAYLDRLAADHRTLVPYFQQQAELTLLEKVYVRLDLCAAEGRVGEGPEGARLGGGEAQTLRELLASDPACYGARRHRWVVRGDPGSGKTTLLRHLAATLAGEAKPRWVPVYAPLPRLMREREFLLDRLERVLERAGVPARGLAAVLDAAGHEGRLLVLLDGLDEVPADLRGDAEGLLRELSSRWPEARLVVATRPIGYRRPDMAFREVEVQPLDRTRREEFLARWFGRGAGEPARERAREALGTLGQDASLWELSGNPLYLTLMALLLEEEQEPARNRTRLYDQVFDLLLEGRHRPEPQPMPGRKLVRRTLRVLARGMTRDNMDAEDLGSLEARLYQEELDGLRAGLVRVPPWLGNLRAFLDALAGRTGILGPHDGPDADWRFWHRTFREALAAEALADEHGQPDGLARILEHAKAIAGDESRWAEAYALLAGRVDEPDALVTALVKTNRALGLRALATAQTLSDETLLGVLELTGGPDERSEVFPRIPELVGDPERALLLLERLRRRTRNGTDLFFLEEALEQLATTWPDWREPVEARRASLFDHVPEPPPELFVTVETCDGRVPLWAPIPAGSFQMGMGPADAALIPERYRSDYVERETPQHEVTITRAFAAAVVPVTKAQYAAFDPEHAADATAKEPQHPAVMVSWYEATAFCRWLARRVGGCESARLPTEAEWEYACRAGTTTAYWSGDTETDLAQVGWYDANSGYRTHRVGEKPANPWGLHDVHGNVREWCHDGLRRYAAETLDKDPEGPKDSGGRVARGGGSWVGADWSRSACRGLGVPTSRDDVVGFRVVLPAAPPPALGLRS